MDRLVYTGIYWVQTGIYRYIPVYTGIYSDILLCAGFRGAHRDAMMPEPSTAPEPEGWDPEEENHSPCPQDHGDEGFLAGQQYLRRQQYLRSQPVAVAVWARQAPPWGPVHPADWGEEASCKRCTAQAGSRDKTGSQDGLSLIPSKGWYNTGISQYVPSCT